jgi:hypothetical protein
VDQLNLEPLGDRRKLHINKLIQSILNDQCHPALLGKFETAADGGLIVKGKTKEANCKIGRRRFSVFAPAMYIEPNNTN